jgi:hypothetical protein
MGNTECVIFLELCFDQGADRIEVMGVMGNSDV